MNNGFVILEEVDLPELKAKGIWAKHKKTGAEVFHVLNDDIENLFSFTFTTTVDDDTGVPHILEHSVLCGSERYPLKEAFIVLAQGSLQTFLNAMTFPDKTVYPASSINEHDYFNLMSVYGNAVFRPLLPEWTFMQEGHRLEFADNGKLSITGVVYNEMKGAYSSLDTYAGHWSIKSIMPDTPYSFESGGAPEHITDLTWEQFKEFHRTRYSPANCRIFLAGNIPTEKQLDFLNEEFFSKLESGKASDPIKLTKKWDSPRNYHIPCPAGSECKSTVFLSWLCNDVTDMYENIALAALTEILLGHDGSPLTRTLIESGLGEDITPVSGLEGEIRETLFVAGLRGVDGSPEQKSKEIEKLIMGLFQKLYDDGIPGEDIEAALLSMEFSQREIRRSGGPFSLIWMRRSLRTWLHGCKPWESLLLDPLLAKIKDNLAKDKRYFENLIKKYFLDNQHRALVIIEPKEDFLPKQEEKLAADLALIEKNMTAEERKSILEKNKILEKIQNEPDSPEALASIPHLERSDLSADADIIHRRHEDLNGVPALYHDLYTNGITYIDLAFPVDILSLEDYLWLPFFTRAIISTGLPGMDYGEVSSLLARTVGGFIALLHTGTSTDKKHDKPDLLGRDWIVFRLKCLDEKIPQSLDLALRLINEADFKDHRRLNDLVLEMKNEIDSSLAPMGHMHAAGRAGRFNSRPRMTEEMWNGLSQIEFIHKLENISAPEIAAKLNNLREKILCSGLIVNITGASFDNAGTQIAQRFSRFGAPVSRSASGFADSEVKEGGQKEVFASPSLQVGFAGYSLNAAPFDTKEQLAESVLAHQFSTGVLWETIRMKGGAYGAMVNSDSVENCVSFATYRDPTPMRSLESINAILKDNSYGKCDNDFLVKSIIGCYAKETRPRTAAENGLIDFYRYLYGIEDSYRKRKLENLVSLTTNDIANAFDSLSARKPTGTVIIAGTKIAEQAAKSLGTDVKILPV
ncbi:MAG: insulinase family protein [Treponema sp.]|jgi:Zn-dependent M16 (insulinase) family peptidase|nr:insulinase family protein [Treponema sp.]